MKYRFFSFIIAPFLLNSNLAALGSNTEKSSPSYINYKNEYILGYGDILEINFLGLNIFNGNYSIQEDGFLNLPEVGKIKAQGETIDELKLILEDIYSEFIYNPKIDLMIAIHRPLFLTLRGEVNKTGLFTLDYEKKANNKSNPSRMYQNSLISPGNQNSRFTNQTGRIVPKLFDLFKLGEGVTAYADLRNIQITRKISDINGGEFVKANVNLISLLESGDQTVNIDLRDGDDVFVPKSKKMLLEQLIEINKSNLTPDYVEVFVNGNVPKVGKIVIKQGSSLREAIAASGGTQGLTGYVEFIRLSRKGKTEKRIINLNNSSKGSTSNPILISGDIIYVRKNLFGKASSALNEYTNPLIKAYGIYKIFE